MSPAPFVDLSQQVSTGNDEGLLGVAFDPGLRRMAISTWPTPPWTGRYR